MLIVGVLFSMKFSIVIPCYNAELYLSECLDSIFANTTVQFEVLLVDDCSVDNTASVSQNNQHASRETRLNNRWMMKKSNESIFVTRPYLPDLEEFKNGCEEIWNNQWLTNNGPRFKKL